jgi:hypothetical protein
VENNLKIQTLALVLAATCALTACEQDPAPSSSGAAKAPDAAAKPAVATLAQAFDSQDEAARPVDAAAVLAVDAPLFCSVDSINETPAQSNVTLPRTDRARFSGFIQAASLDEPSILVLRSDDAAFFVNNVPTAERADIAKDKGIQGSSAFDYSTFATLSDVPAGTYKIELLSKVGSEIRRCASSVAVAVN